MKINILKIFKTCSLIGILTALFISYTTASQSAFLLFEEMDKNDDLVVLESEFLQTLQNEAFKQIDSNDNQSIESTEWVQYDKSDLAKQHFSNLDKNKDSELSLIELKEGKMQFLRIKDSKGNMVNTKDLFHQFDENNDGSISSKEHTAKSKTMLIRVFSFEF